MNHSTRYHMIGTAGHVDHGKTVLISKLTGINTDRLREEQERGISIDLGFAPFRLDDGGMVGISNTLALRHFSMSAKISDVL